MSSVSIDNINRKRQVGGPSNYGGVALEIISNVFELNYLNIANIAAKNLTNISTLSNKNVVYNFIDETVEFKLSYKDGKRKVELISNPFKVDSVIFRKFKIDRDLKNDTIVVSPIINEFSRDFFLHLFALKPKAIFLDLFNNDDGFFSKFEINLLKYLLKVKRNNNLIIKFSENEFRGISKHVDFRGVDVGLIITKGKKGVYYEKSGLFFSKKGINVKVNSTIGAGDILIYAFAAFYELGFSEENCLELSNLFAAKSTNFIGVANKFIGLKKILSNDFLRVTLNHNKICDYDSLILDLRELLAERKLDFIQSVFLYGSVVRNESLSKISDLDVMIIINKNILTAIEIKQLNKINEMLLRNRKIHMSFRIRSKNDFLMDYPFAHDFGPTSLLNYIRDGKHIFGKNASIDLFEKLKKSSSYADVDLRQRFIELREGIRSLYSVHKHQFADSTSNKTATSSYKYYRIGDLMCDLSCNICYANGISFETVKSAINYTAKYTGEKIFSKAFEIKSNNFTNFNYFKLLEILDKIAYRFINLKNYHVDVLIENVRLKETKPIWERYGDNFYFFR